MLPLVKPDGFGCVITQDQLLVTLPPPHPALHAHNNGHWRKKSPFVWSLRQMAVEACRSVAGLNWQQVRLHYQFVFCDRKRRDVANCIQSLKPAVDGIVDAGVIPDDNYQHLIIGSATCLVEPANPRTVLTFERLG